MYIFNKTVVGGGERRLDSIISRAVEHIMMLVFFIYQELPTHYTKEHLTTTIRWSSTLAKTKKNENWIDTVFKGQCGKMLNNPLGTKKSKTLSRQSLEMEKI